MNYLKILVSIVMMTASVFCANYEDEDARVALRVESNIQFLGNIADNEASDFLSKAAAKMLLRNDEVLATSENIQETHQGLSAYLLLCVAHIMDEQQKINAIAELFNGMDMSK